jgi:hypothetical protein
MRLRASSRRTDKARDARRPAGRFEVVKRSGTKIDRPLLLRLAALAALLFGAACSSPAPVAPARLRIEILGFESCAHTPATRAHVERAVADSRLAADVVYVDQETLAPADPRRCWAAPTVLVDGVDLFGEPRPRGTDKRCRLYPDGAPSVAEIRAGLDAVTSSQASAGD